MWLRGYATYVRQLTEKSAEICLSCEKGVACPAVLPGQFIVLEAPTKSGIQLASFSVVRVQDQQLFLGIKQVRKGGVSEWANQLKSSESVRFAGPYGSFLPEDNDSGHVLIAGGSGITPIFALLQHFLARHVVPELIYFNEDPDQVMYGDELRKAHRDGFCNIIEVFDRNVLTALDQVKFQSKAVYVCGPTVLSAEIEQALIGRGQKSLALESYASLIPDGPAGSFIWETKSGQEQNVQVKRGQSVLDAASECGVQIDFACRVGQCKSCAVHVKKGTVMVDDGVISSGNEALSCLAVLHGSDPIVLSQRRSWSRSKWVVAALLIAFVSIGIWAVPPGIGLRSKGTMNTGHENLKCESCHTPADGTLRQQLGHNARVALGILDDDWADVGHSHVSNTECQGCHDRPNDRHPVSRFEEIRFAEQRLTLGPHRCVNCRGEHTGQRIARVETGFCVNCHGDLDVANDPIDVPHSELVASGEWSTCLTCHDFHGNHVYDVPIKMENRLRLSEIQAYFEGGKDPYGEQKKYLPKETP